MYTILLVSMDQLSEGGELLAAHLCVLPQLSQSTMFKAPYRDQELMARRRPGEPLA